MLSRKKNKRNFYSSLTAVFIVGLLVIPIQAQATIITFDLDIEFSGAASPAGTAPWLKATFEDSGVNMVTLTMDASGLQGSGEFVSGWYFNSTVVPLTESHQSGATGSFSQVANTADQTAGFKADGDGFFDFKFEFGNGDLGPKDGGPLTSVYKLTGTGITANSFNTISHGGPANKTGFGSAAHVQGIAPDSNNNTSGWIAPSNPPMATPIPNAALLFGTGLLGLIGFSRLRKKN